MTPDFWGLGGRGGVRDVQLGDGLELCIVWDATFYDTTTNLNDLGLIVFLEEASE